jgi:hypothetical protein
MAHKRKRYRSKGGWVMGSFWPTGKVAELYEIQAAAYMPAILVEVDAAGNDIAAVRPASVAPTPASHPARVVNPPPPASQRQRRRVGMTTSLAASVPISASALSGPISRPDPAGDQSD